MRILALPYNAMSLMLEIANRRYIRVHPPVVWVGGTQNEPNFRLSSNISIILSHMLRSAVERYSGYFRTVETALVFEYDQDGTAVIGESVKSLMRR